MGDSVVNFVHLAFAMGAFDTSLNFSLNSLILKLDAPEHISHFLSIALCNVLVKSLLKL